MPVDRKLRDQLADNLAAYLRGQDGKELRAQLGAMGRDGGPGAGYPSPETMPATDDEAAQNLWAILWFEISAGTVACSAREWESHCRDLAFLRSDQEQTAPSSLGDSDLSSSEILAARWHLLAVAPAIALAFQRGSVWLYLACTALSMVVYLLVRNVRERKSHQRWADSYWPFHDRQDWEAHRQTLNDLRIPEYDPVLHGESFWTQFWSWLIPGALMGCFFLFSLTMAPFWPLWLLGMAFQSTRQKPAPTADGGEPAPDDAPGDSD